VFWDADTEGLLYIVVAAAQRGPDAPASNGDKPGSRRAVPRPRLFTAGCGTFPPETIHAKLDDVKVGRMRSMGSSMGLGSRQEGDALSLGALI
jgi:hypothetical protein